MKYRRSGKQLDTETATILVQTEEFQIMKNSNNALFYVSESKTGNGLNIQYITEEQARTLCKEKVPDVEFKVFEKKDYDIRIRLTKEQNSILFDMAYENKTDKKHMLMELIDKALCDYQDLKNKNQEK